MSYVSSIAFLPFPTVSSSSLVSYVSSIAFSFSLCFGLPQVHIILVLACVLCFTSSVPSSLPDMRRDVQEVFKMTPHEKQVMMFSATLPKEIRPIAKKFMNNV